MVARDRQNEAQGLQVSIRGFGARSTFGIRGVRLYTDGIPATMPDGQGQVSHFMLESAGRIEVLRGPFSALYGNSSGGVISVFSADAPAAPELSAGFVAGSDGLAPLVVVVACALGRRDRTAARCWTWWTSTAKASAGTARRDRTAARRCSRAASATAAATPCC